MADRPEDDAQERTEQATPRRLEQAREKGNVARSRELSTSAVMLASAAAITLTGPGVVDNVLSVMREAFQSPLAVVAGDRSMESMLMRAIVDALFGLAPFLAIVMVAGVLSATALGGIAFSAQAFSFKWEKLDPIKGLKRQFSLNGLMELAKALAKFVVITGTTIVVIWTGAEELLTLNAQPLAPALAHTSKLVVFAFLCLGMATLLIALVDVPFQLWNHARQLRMTRRELKDDMKETEGKPEVRAKVRALQREIAQRRMMEAIPSADVVVTNPSHYAVALSYKPERMDAPRLVAKGADLVAARIRETANLHDVPIVEAPMLARAVYHSTRIDSEIPVGLYVAVAQVLAYVYRLRAYTGPGQPPELDPDLPIPEELRR